MKKIILSGAVLLAFAGISCSSDDDNSRNHLINYSDLSTDCKSFVETNFPGSEILRVVNDTRSVNEYYEIYLAGGVQIDMNQSCQWTEVDGNNQSIPTNFILPSIIEYVSTNYANTSIESIEKKPYGFDVDLLNNIDLRFDSNGNFIGLGN